MDKNVAQAGDGTEAGGPDADRSSAPESRWEEIERIGLQPQPSDVTVAAFARCASAACVFELVLRRYADNTQALEGFAFRDLSKVVDAVTEHVKTRTSDEERALLNKCAVVRNKLFHLELSRATGQLKSFGAELNEGRVWLIDLADGTPTKVAETSTKTGRIYGWLLESTSNKAFDRGVQLFRRGIALIGWLRAKDEGA